MDTSRRRPTSGPPVAWRVALASMLWLLRRVFGWQVRARRPETVPTPTQPLVVVCNHTSTVDAFLVADVVWRRLQHWCQPLVKAELYDHRLVGGLVRRAGAIPVARSEGSGREAAYGAAIDRLRDGGTIVLAPEGTTTHDGSLLPLRHGAARLALEAGVDVLVVTHFGAQRGFSPVVRVPDRGAVVTMTVDLLSPWPGEDASSLTGRIAATLLDRSAELRATYPQADHGARWWPPYAVPASPTATARDNLERYRHSMADTITQARQRMAEMADGHEVEQRVSHARDRAVAAAEDLAERSRLRTEAFTEQTRARTEALREQTRARTAELSEQTRHRVDDLTAQARERAAAFSDQLRGPDGEPAVDRPAPELDPDTGDLEGGPEHEPAPRSGSS